MCIVHFIMYSSHGRIKHILAPSITTDSNCNSVEVVNRVETLHCCHGSRLCTFMMCVNDMFFSGKCRTQDEYNNSFHQAVEPVRLRLWSQQLRQSFPSKKIWSNKPLGKTTQLVESWGQFYIYLTWKFGIIKLRMKIHSVLDKAGWSKWWMSR